MSLMLLTTEFSGVIFIVRLCDTCAGAAVAQKVLTGLQLDF